MSSMLSRHVPVPRPDVLETSHSPGHQHVKHFFPDLSLSEKLRENGPRCQAGFVWPQQGQSRLKRLHVAVRGRCSELCEKGVNIGFISLHKLIRNPCSQNDEDYLVVAARKKCEAERRAVLQQHWRASSHIDSSLDWGRVLLKVTPRNESFRDK